jgi:segregation and condensation protein B
MASENSEIQEEIKLSPVEVRSIIECLLFSTSEPLSLNKISKIIPDIPQKEIRDILLQLIIAYDEEGKGIQILEVAGGYQMATRKRFARYVIQLNKQKKRHPLTNSALETLAIIAYKQPIIRAEIEAVRGVDSSGVIRSLVDLGVVKMVGKKEVIGRPSLYGTTEEFLKMFGLRRLSDLPSIKELRSRFEKSSK